LPNLKFDSRDFPSSTNPHYTCLNRCDNTCQLLRQSFNNEHNLNNENIMKKSETKNKQICLEYNYDYLCI